MVIFHKWTVKGAVYLAYVSISKVTDVFKAKWNRRTFKLKTSIPLSEVNRWDAARAFARLCVRYKMRGVKLGESIAVAWG